ncbi:MAG: hypothetical protein RIQ48_447 [Pseudomonadota bacterium]|jgi:hypothetical protein
MTNYALITNGKVTNIVEANSQEEADLAYCDKAVEILDGEVVHIESSWTEQDGFESDTSNIPNKPIPDAGNWVWNSTTQEWQESVNG